MKRTLVLRALLLLAACADSPEDLLAKAEAAYAAKDFTVARIHATQALRDDPQNPRLLLIQARSLLALGDGEGAQNAINRLAGSKPPAGELALLAAEAALLRRLPDRVLTVLGEEASAEAERLKAMAWLQKQDTVKAREALERAVAAGGSAAVLADFARMELIEDRPDAALDLLMRAEKADPDLLAVLLVGGEIHARRGDPARALGYFDRAVKGWPGNLAAQTGRAAVLGELGRLDDLEAALKPLEASMADNPDIRFLRARLALARKDWEGVRALVQPEESRLEAQDPLRLVYAEALLRLGRAELAIAQAGPIARAQRSNRHAAAILAEAQLAAGDAQAALTTFRSIGASPEARAEERSLLARIAKAAGDPAAVQLAARAAQPAAQALAADLAEADAAIRSGAWARAVTAYDRILAVTDGRNVLVVNNMAYAQSMLGNHAKALDFAERARKLAPDNASVLDTGGMVRLRAGRDLPEALRLLRLAAQKDPANPAIRARLAEAERRAG